MAAERIDTLGSLGFIGLFRDTPLLCRTPLLANAAFAGGGLFYTGRFMSKLLEGKLALILGIANKWSLAYAIAQAFSREGATLVLTYLGERQKDAIEELSQRPERGRGSALRRHQGRGTGGAHRVAGRR